MLRRIGGRYPFFGVFSFHWGGRKTFWRRERYVDRFRRRIFALNRPLDYTIGYNLSQYLRRPLKVFEKIVRTAIVDSRKCWKNQTYRHRAAQLRQQGT